MQAVTLLGCPAELLPRLFGILHNPGYADLPAGPDMRCILQVASVCVARTRQLQVKPILIHSPYCYVFQLPKKVLL